MSKFDINLPPALMDENLPAEEKYKQLHNYLFQLNEQLQYSLNNLDYDNMTPAMQSRIAQVEQKTKDLSSSGETAQEIFDRISQEASVVEEQFQSFIKKTDQAISTQVERLQLVEGDVSGIHDQISTMTQDSAKVEMKFDDRFEITKDGVGNVEDYVSRISEVITFDKGGIWINRDSNSRYYSHFDEDIIEFRQKGAANTGVAGSIPIAFIKDGRMFVKNTEVDGSLSFRSSIDQNQKQFAFKERTNGNLSLKWMDTEVPQSGGSTSTPKNGSFLEATLNNKYTFEAVWQESFDDTYWSNYSNVEVVLYCTYNPDGAPTDTTLTEDKDVLDEAGNVIVPREMLLTPEEEETKASYFISIDGNRYQVDVEDMFIKNDTIHIDKKYAMEENKNTIKALTPNVKTEVARCMAPVRHEEDGSRNVKIEVGGRGKGITIKYNKDKTKYANVNREVAFSAIVSLAERK